MTLCITERGGLHSAIAEVPAAEAKLYLFVGIDRTATFAAQPRNCNTPRSRPMHFEMICEAGGGRVPADQGQSSRDQWPGPVARTSCQVGRIPFTACRQTGAGQRNRTIRGATVKRFPYDSPDPLRTHLADFLLRRGQPSKGLRSVPASPTTPPAG